MIARFRSDNSSYQNGDVIRIEIPTGRRGQHLFPKSSFIEGNVSVNTTSYSTSANEGVYIDQSVFALFNRMRVIHGSTVIEDYLYCNKIWTSILDLQYNESERRSLSVTHLVASDSSQVPSYNSGCFGLKVGDVSSTASTASDTTAIDFCFPLPSGILGTLSQKALPLGACGAASIYLELELASPNTAFILEDLSSGTSATINRYTVSNIYYNAKITNLPADVDAALLQSTGGIINLPAVSYKTEYKNIASSVTTFTDKFSFQFSSLKNFCFFIQNASIAAGVKNKRSVSSRPKGYISDYFISINGEAFPSQTITTSSRMYAELLRAYDMLTDTTAGGIINYQNYTGNNDIYNSGVFKSSAKGKYGDDGTTYQERFLAGIDLDRFNHQNSTLMSGTSSIGQLVSLILNFSSSTNAAAALYAFVMYDVMYNVENGMITMKI